METQSCLEDQLVLLEATIEDNEEMKSLVERVLLEKGLEEAVTTVVSSWGKEQRARAQQEVITRAGPYWKVCPALSITKFIFTYLWCCRCYSCSRLTSH